MTKKTNLLTTKDFDASNALLRMVVESMPELVFVKDSEFRIVLCNPAFIAAYPKEKQDRILGYTTIEEYSPKERDYFLLKDREALETGYSKAIEFITLPNGAQSVLETKKIRFYDNDNSPYILGMARDITETHSLIKSLEKSNQRLEEFVRVASHDLRAPLNGVSQLIEWIEEDQTPPFEADVAENFVLIKNRVLRMGRLLDDLLTYSRAGNEKDNLIHKPFKPWLEDTFAFVSAQQSAQIIADDTKLCFPALAFDVIFGNLMSNTLKHAECSAMEITVSIEERDNSLIIRYSDNGKGINLTYKDTIFDVFKTLDSRDDKDASGVGLSVARKTLENYGGSIHLCTDTNPSSTFIIQCPKFGVDHANSRH